MSTPQHVLDQVRRVVAQLAREALAHGFAIVVTTRIPSSQIIGVLMHRDEVFDMLDRQWGGEPGLSAFKQVPTCKVK